jgi:peptide/nickel transport system substrate-binding protein
VYAGLASAWEPNADYSEFTFTLREDVTFHDGTAFKADAVKASFDHIMSEGVLESGGKSLLQDHEYIETVVVDDYTVTVKFAASYPLFLRDAARQWLSISSPAALEEFGDYGRNPVGTPFKFVQWDASLRCARTTPITTGDLSSPLIRVLLFSTRLSCAFCPKPPHA